VSTPMRLMVGIKGIVRHFAGLGEGDPDLSDLVDDKRDSTAIPPPSPPLACVVS
jgi:hypothetical protein